MEKDVTTSEEHSTVLEAMTEIAKSTDKTQVAQIIETPEPTQVSVPAQPPAPVPAAENKKDYVTEDYIDSVTDVAISMIDSVQEMCFTISANSKKKDVALRILPENGVTRLTELRAEKKANRITKVEVVTEVTGTDAKLLNLDAVVEEFIEQLPFTPKQIKNMKPGLRVMVEKNAGRIPPEMIFFLGLATAIGGNIAEYKSVF